MIHSTCQINQVAMETDGRWCRIDSPRNSLYFRRFDWLYSDASWNLVWSTIYHTFIAMACPFKTCACWTHLSRFRQKKQCHLLITILGMVQLEWNHEIWGGNNANLDRAALHQYWNFSVTDDDVYSSSYRPSTRAILSIMSSNYQAPTFYIWAIWQLFITLSYRIN